MEKTIRRSRGKQIQKPNGGHTARQRGRGSDFIVQGSLLAAAGIIVRLIGMLYKIPLVEKIGDEGMGYYSAAYSVYSILLIMSSYSLPVAVSKMIAVRLAKNQYRNAGRILKAALFYGTLVGSIGALALWFGADFFAEAIKMPFSSYALKTLAPTVWIMSYLGVLRGYFQGHSTMVPTAVSQILEQVINAIISIVAAGTLFNMGLRSNLVYNSTEYSYAFGAAGGTIGTGVGALAALLFMLLLIINYLPVMRRRIKRGQSSHVESYGQISYVMCATIVPIIVSSVIYNISSVVDNYMFGNAMDALGKGGEIAKSWGVYMGKYHLLFNIPVAIANSLSSSLIPSLSGAVEERNKKQVISKISSSVRFAMMIAIPSTVGLTVLAAPISNLLFAGADNEMLIRMTMAGSVAVVFFSLSTVTNAVLQGLNRMRIPIRNAAISLIAHVGILAGMLYILKLGIYSVLYSNIIFALMICILNSISIGRVIRYRQEIKKTFIIPTVASGIMGAAAYGVYQLFYLLTSGLLKGRLGTAVCIMPAILAAVLIYFILLIKMGGVNGAELRTMPGGTRLARVAARLHLM